MHTTIRVIVPAKTPEQARERAEQTLTKLSSAPFDGPFDSCVALGVVDASSPVGKSLIDEGIRWTHQAFTKNVQEIRALLARHGDDDLFECKDVIGRLHGAFRACCRDVGDDRGLDIWLYDDQGQGILNRTELAKVLRKGPRGRTSWVVPADVHL